MLIWALGRPSPNATQHHHSSSSGRVTVSWAADQRIIDPQVCRPRGGLETDAFGTDVFRTDGPHAEVVALGLARGNLSVCYGRMCSVDRCQLMCLERAWHCDQPIGRAAVPAYIVDEWNGRDVVTSTSAVGRGVASPRALFRDVPHRLVAT